MSDQSQTPATNNMEKRVQQFVQLRDLIKQLDDAHKEKIKPLKLLQDRVGGELQSFMTSNSLESLKTAAGTCYTSSKTTASLADPEAFMKYVIQHSAFDLIDRRANSTAVKDFVKNNNGQLPPGCNLSIIETIGVRRATGSTTE